MSSNYKDRMLPTRLVCERYNISDRTVDRWLENGILPTPVRINGLRYWRQHELERHERELLSKQQDQDCSKRTRRYQREGGRERR